MAENDASIEKIYSVVEFLRENSSMFVVPKTWIHGQYCLWPPCNNLRKIELMVEKYVQSESSWKKLKVKAWLPSGKDFAFNYFC